MALETFAASDWGIGGLYLNRRALTQAPKLKGRIRATQAAMGGTAAEPIPIYRAGLSASQRSYFWSVLEGGGAWLPDTEPLGAVPIVPAGGLLAWWGRRAVRTRASRKCGFSGRGAVQPPPPS